uniref:Uncharacterized protein n=1 Tax=Zooxanthella nutricula TaxID=1333877 RepID=A0A7S2PPB0_9DINO|mmetsp:Transcript_62491/g.191133  ORF Transcript_62491/g.191133 Transcript_62491/m.191133 type:complete len:221 (+) Transcript_62491:3-665(+)
MVAVLSTRTLEWTVAAHHGEVPWKHRADHASAIPSSGAWMYLYSGQHRDEKTGHWFRLKDMWRVALPRAKLEDWHQLGDLNAARSSVPVLVLPSGWLLALGGHFVADDEEIKAKGQEDVAGMIDHHRQKDFKAYNDVLALHVDEPTATTWHVVEEDAPWPARDDCAAAVVGDSVLLFGGGTVYGGGGYLGDVWRLPSASRRYGLKGAAGGRGGDRGSGEL